MSGSGMVSYVHAGRGLAMEHVFSLHHEFSLFVFVEGRSYATAVHWLFDRAFTFREGLKVDWKSHMNVIQSAVLWSMLSNTCCTQDMNKVEQENVSFLQSITVRKERSATALQDDLCMFAEAVVAQYKDEIKQCLMLHANRVPAFLRNESVTWSNAQHFYFEFAIALQVNANINV